MHRLQITDPKAGKIWNLKARLNNSYCAALGVIRAVQIGFDLDKGIEFQDNNFDIQRKLTAEEISSYELFLGGQRYMT